MTAYAYRALHASGRIKRGEMEAANENELAHYLSQSGMELIEARAAKKNAMRQISRNRRTPPRALAAFCMRMHDLLLAGIAFPEALRETASTIDNAAMGDALTQILRMISNGNGIAASFAAYPRIFTPIFVAMIGAGEKSGDMTEIFEFLSRHTASSADAREKLQRALRYPLFLLLVAGSAIGFMMVMVVPQIAQFLTSIEGHLPLSTRILVFVSSLFTQYGAFLVGGTFSCILGTLLMRQIFPSFALAIDASILRLPVIGKVISKNALARFAHSFSILFKSGCAVPECLRQAGEVIGNRSLRAGIEAAEQRVISGSSLSQALDNIIPPFAVGLLRTGERSGDLAKALDNLTLSYDREAQAAADHMIGLMEPCLTLIIGGFLTWTVVAILGPLYGSVTVLGGRM